MWNRKVGIRIIEVLLCIACVVALRVTDDESRRVTTYLRYRSREWSLLSNVTWGSIGAALATATCGGYVIITTGLLIAAASGELRGRKTEIFMLGLGVILFGIVGSLTLASIEHVPEDLVDNAAVLGILCLITALAFIADLLMSTSLQKTKHDGTQTLVDRDSARPMANVTVEMESKKSKANGLDANGNVNEAFDKVSKHRAKDEQAPSEGDSDGRARVTLASTARESDIPFIDAERQLSASRATHTRNSEGRDDSRAYYQGQEVILRPVDEMDTPRFPRDVPESYAKIINPSVTIMRVDRDEDDNHGRYSDSSQYDNVPTRMAPGILKRGRDAYYASSRSYAAGPAERRKDEIEMLEEWVGILRKSTTGTQTSPASPTDPGYVRHTASNWPRDFKQKTPGTSPVRD